MAKKYILDTNIISYLVDENSKYCSIIQDKLSSLSDNDSVGVSILTLYELSYGLEYSTKEEQIEIFNNSISLIQDYLHIYDLKVTDITNFGKLKREYKNRVGINQKALKKNDLDFLIASTAISSNTTLVSNDKIFEVIAKIDSRLKYENWLID